VELLRRLRLQLLLKCLQLALLQLELPLLDQIIILLLPQLELRFMPFLLMINLHLIIELMLMLRDHYLHLLP
jgi:hypothetical protein